MEVLTTLTIGIALSMDAFSLALAYGTQGLNKKKTIVLSIIVGIYHFLMPLIGYAIGHTAIEKLSFANNIIVFIILFAIGIEMIVSTLKAKEKVKNLNLIGMLLFGLAVSMDSFAVGLGLNIINKNIFIATTIFALTSFTFAYIGFNLGRIINQKIGKYSTIFGGFTLIIISIIYLLTSA